MLRLLLRARRRPAVTGTAALIGLSGRIIRWTGMEGEVLVQGERWHARATDTLEPGQAVRVVGRHGLTLLVDRA
jgi:membrane-bound serine protease (ClpP class)